MLRPRQGACRHRSRADLLKPASHRRLGRHRRDVSGGCRVFDPCWLDQARRLKLRRHSSTPPDAASQVPTLCEPPVGSAPRETSGTEGSNPPSSSRESTNFRSLSDGRSTTNAVARSSSSRTGAARGRYNVVDYQPGMTLCPGQSARVNITLPPALRNCLTSRSVSCDLQL